jgi:hypothetical protein
MRATLEEYKKVTVKTNKHLSDLEQKKTSTPDIKNNTSLT